MILGIDMGFWIGMGITAAITFTGCAVAWGMALKKDKKK